MTDSTKDYQFVTKEDLQKAWEDNPTSIPLTFCRVIDLAKRLLKERDAYREAGIEMAHAWSDRETGEERDYYIAEIDARARQMLEEKI